MRATILFVSILLTPNVLFSQSNNSHSPYEIFGTISYDYSNTKRQWSGESNYYTYETHAITFQPSCGYFLTDNIELLADLRYKYSSFYDSDFGTERAHTLGFDIGALYNLQANPFLSVFVGPKIGLSWWRGGLFEDINIYDPGWSKRQLIFPIILTGGRVAITKDCSIIMLIEYSHTKKSYTPVSYWIMNEDAVSFGVGFSIFL